MSCIASLYLHYLKYNFVTMEVIYLLIGCSILVALVFLVAFIWNVRSGQYDDTYSPAVRILFDEEPKSNPNHEFAERETGKQ